MSGPAADASGFRTPGGQPPPGCPAHAGGSGGAAGPAVSGPAQPVGPYGPGGVTRLFGPEASADPVGLYERLRADHGPVAPVLLEGDVPAWLVLGYHEILEVCRHPRRYSRDGRNWRDWQNGVVGPHDPIAPVLAWGPDATHQDGAVHHRLRGAVNESLERFDRRAIRRLVARYANHLINEFVDAGEAELLSQYAQLLPMRVMGRLAGLDEEDGPPMTEAARQLLIGTEKAVTADQFIQRRLRELVAAKHEAPGSDLASWLIEHPARLTDEEVLHHLRLVLVSANETTTNLIVNTLRVVFTHPRFRGSLHGGRMTLPAAVEQVLWDEPPIAVCPGGFAMFDMELGGQHIKKGDAMLLALSAGNVDPVVRPAPGTMMYGNRSHLSFTSGTHECPGADIGRAITGSAIEALLYRLPDIHMTIEADELTWSASTWSRHLDRLPVRFTPRDAPTPIAPIRFTPEELGHRAVQHAAARDRLARGARTESGVLTAVQNPDRSGPGAAQGPGAGLRDGRRSWWNRLWGR
ncbi:cytochrome P450 [Streptomyces sp. XM4011]|uniref:cytochrome P450 n=1 Tax=Streptomyces sp. XM4011 TaxID=2929780 RepID=UPI001FF85A7C|nr:cytochrome P450 [Streptomyces sp. XM4011]MCK1814081.1 cytochrome P450 [Streptomyces sp. XM4011]